MRKGNQGIEKGIIGEGLIGRHVRTFVSVVDGRTYFGFKNVRTGEIIEAEEVKDLRTAIDKVIKHAIQCSN